MAPSGPRKRRVNRPENEEVAAWLFLKHRAMAEQQPGGLPEHQARALSTAYRCVCATNVPIRTFGDLARLRGVGGWVVDVMEDSFPGSSLDLSPPRSNTPGETGKKNTRNKPYVPWLKSAAYAIMITLYREMERGKEFMMRQELIDAAEASGLSQHAIGPNNSRNSRNDGYSFTGWNSMKTLTNKDLVEKKSNPAKKASHMFWSECGSAGSKNVANLWCAFASSPFFISTLNTNRSSPCSVCISFSLSGALFANHTHSGSAQKCLLAMPPHQSNESFLKAYEVVLILDDRETFGRKVVGNIHSQISIPIEIKHLPVGDALWIARHKELDTEYFLDFIVERKNVDDFLGSIKDNRYKDQKLRLKKCGLTKLIYLVEGDVNTVDGSESVKTVLEGFDVQRTTGYADTEKKYGHVTGSIVITTTQTSLGVLTLRKVTMSDIFVPQVTEEAALAVTSLYPTLLPLPKAYTMLDGDRRAQEEMLKNKSDMVNAGASKNIFKLIWAGG
ncbi:hypothetical protein VPH35_055123 [Triticum aestivum]